jgi:hypothetical protein
MLEEFRQERSKSNDYWGAHKGAANQYGVSDPVKFFQRIGQRLRNGEAKGEEKIEWRKEKRADDGDRDWDSSAGCYAQDIAPGDMESYKVA